MTFYILSVVIVSCFTGLFCQNVVDVAVSLGLNKLAQAINDTGLYEEWATDDEAKLNLFGPTDKAFTEAENAGIIKDSTSELKSLLTYHAISATSHGLLTLDKINNDVVTETVNTGDSLRFNIYENPGHKAYSVNGARIDESRQDNIATNGLVQVIDKVLILPLYNVYTLLQNNKDLATLLSAVNLTDLPSTLNGDGNFTVFAPTNDAFAKIPEDDLNDLLADKDALTATLLYHIIDSTYYNVGLHNGIQLTTMQGDSISISKESNVQINNASSVVYADVTVTNGVVHVIDTVLTPNHATNCTGTTLWNLVLTIMTIISILHVRS